MVPASSISQGQAVCARERLCLLAVEVVALVVGEYSYQGEGPRRMLCHVCGGDLLQSVHQTGRDGRVAVRLPELQGLLLKRGVFGRSHLLRQHRPAGLPEDCESLGAVAQRVHWRSESETRDVGGSEHLGERR